MMRWLGSVIEHEFGKTPGDSGEQQGGRACYGPWSQKELDTTQ